MKTISRIEAPIVGRGSFEGALDAARRVAEHFQSSIDVCFIRPAAPRAGEAGGRAAKAALLDRIREQGDEAAQLAYQRFRAWSASNPAGSETSWHVVQGRVDEVIARRGSLADLIVLQRSAEAPSAVEASFEAAVFRAGRLAMVVDEALPANYLDHALVVWDRSAETARALSLSLPFLRAASSVSILVTEDQVPATELTGLMTYLAGQSIDVRRVPASPTAALLEVAKDCCATLLIMGAYTRSRLQEVLYGGVTRDILASPGVPALLAH